MGKETSAGNPPINWADIARLKKMNPAQIYTWLAQFYRVAYEDGLREGEREFADAIIVSEDEFIDKVGADALDALTENTDGNYCG